MSEEIRNQDNLSYEHKDNEQQPFPQENIQKEEAPAVESAQTAQTNEEPIKKEPTPSYTQQQPTYQANSQPNYNYQPMMQNMNNGYQTGYYSSMDQQNRTSAMYSSPAQPYGYQQNNYGQYNQHYNQPEYTNKKKKKEKKKSNAGLVFGCILISLAFGFAGAFGALFVDGMLNKGDKNDNADKEHLGSTVIYEAVDREIPESTTKAGTVASVAQYSLPTVVEIRTEAVVNNSFYGQYVTEGAGSGVIISTDGYIVTNNHVVAGSSNIKVRLSTGDEHEAKLIGTDSQTDLAVIKIEAKDLPCAVYGDSSKLIIGELTVAIGNPLGELGGTVTDGIISALDREITVDGENMVLLQTNAAVNPGNSGGGLFNSNGELIGIVNAKSSGDNIEGLGFAIPINTAKPIIKDLIEKGHVTGRPSIGITIVEVSTDYHKYMYGVNDYGVYIQKALSEDFKAGDRIIAIDGNSVSYSSDIKSILSSHKVGDEITVTVSRKNKIVDVKVKLIDSSDNNLSTEE